MTPSGPELRPHTLDILSIVIDCGQVTNSYRATLTPDGISAPHTLTAPAAERHQMTPYERAVADLDDPGVLEQSLRDAVDAAWVRVRNLLERPESPVRARLLAEAVAHAQHCAVVHAASTAPQGTQRTVAFELLRAGYDGTAQDLLRIVGAAHQGASCHR